MKAKQTAQNLIQFYTEAEKLKSVMRHSWTSDTTRRESTAEHTWMLCLMALTIFDSLEFEVDQLRVLKMLIIHDLAEAITGDIPAFEISDRKAQKYQTELAAMKHLLRNLEEKTKKDILSLWEEMEQKQTPEAKLAQIIDKSEAAMQHAIAGAKTWDDGDFNHHGAHAKLDHTASELLSEIRDEITKISIKSVEESNQMHRLNDAIKQEHERITKQS